MHLRFSILFSCLLAFLPVSGFAGGKADQGASLSFHLETGEQDNPKMIFPEQVGGKTRYFRRLPEISIKDVASFRPFPADDNSTYGLVLRLRTGAQRRLAAISSANQDRWLIAQSGGRVVDAVIIDQPVEDGVIVIWKGVLLSEIELLDQEMPRIGKEKDWKKKR